MTVYRHSGILFATFLIYEGNIYGNYCVYVRFKMALIVKTESENKEYLLKTQTEEMRHMIGKQYSLYL
jgi:hypothetical protein